MDLFDVILAKKMSGGSGGGGGGSSDLSTAEVTFISMDSTWYSVMIFFLDEEIGIIRSDPVTVDTPKTVKVPIGEHGAVLPLTAFNHIDGSVLPTTTENITFTSDGVFITGDGTFTAKGVSEG